VSRTHSIWLWSTRSWVRIPSLTLGEKGGLAGMFCPPQNIRPVPPVVRCTTSLYHSATHRSHVAPDAYELRWPRAERVAHRASRDARPRAKAGAAHRAGAAADRRLVWPLDHCCIVSLSRA
jgi:hypothetical protein